MIFVEVSGDVQVARAFERAGTWIRDRFKKVVQTEGDRLRTQVQSSKLSGAPHKRKPGDPLGVGSVLASRTGRLRASVIAKMFDREKTVSVQIYPTAANRGDRYGFMLGTGAHKTVNIGGYTRSAPERDRFASAHVSANGKVKAIKRSSGVEFVKAARRHINLNRRPFTVASLLEHRSEITKHMQDAVTQVSGELQAQVNGVSCEEGI